MEAKRGKGTFFEMEGDLKGKKRNKKKTKKQKNVLWTSKEIFVFGLCSLEVMDLDGLTEVVKRIVTDTYYLTEALYKTYQAVVPTAGASVEQETRTIFLERLKRFKQDTFLFFSFLFFSFLFFSFLFFSFLFFSFLFFSFLFFSFLFFSVLFHSFLFFSFLFFSFL